MQISKISLKNNPDLVFIADFLKPYTQRAYLVGGSVRDLLLGFKLNDYDIELYDLSLNDFEKAMQKLKAQGVGKSFFVYKFKNFDLALARTENKISYGHKGFEVKICNDEKIGAKRRDFSFNALMINLFNGELLDFYGGVEDLKQGLIRHIDSKSFQEDSLRILRAITFVSRFGFKIAKESLSLMQNMDINDLSQDRINAELYKIFKSSYLALAYEYLQILGLEKKLFNFDSSFAYKEFKTMLENSRKTIKDEALFLYLYLNFFGLNKEEFFKKTKLKKELLRKVNQVFFKDKMSDFDLAKIAFDMPLKEWLGLWDKKRIQRAKNLKLYEKKFQSKIKPETLIKQGFVGKKLGLRLKELKEEELCEYLKRLKK